MTENTSESTGGVPAPEHTVTDHTVIHHSIDDVKHAIDDAVDAMHRLEHVAPNALAEEEYEHPHN